MNVHFRFRFVFGLKWSFIFVGIFVYGRKWKMRFGRPPVYVTKRSWSWSWTGLVLVEIKVIKVVDFDLFKTFLTFFKTKIKAKALILVLKKVLITPLCPGVVPYVISFSKELPSFRKMCPYYDSFLFLTTCNKRMSISAFRSTTHWSFCLSKKHAKIVSVLLFQVH